VEGIGKGKKGKGGKGRGRKVGDFAS